MKHLFLLNPATLHKKKEREALINQIKTQCNGQDYEIYFSSSAKGSCDKALSEAKKGDEICIYIGGGDGSIQMIAEAIYTYPNVILSVIPLGTGNDFIRNFGTKQDFLKLNHINNGTVHEIDLIKCNDRICANMINIGFDESVVRRVASLKKFPLMSNSFAYTIGVFIQLLKYPHEKLHIEYDDGTSYDDKFLLTFIANGGYCGGGYHSASKADIDDGLIDTMLIYPMSRFKFLRLVGKYQKGKIIGSKLQDSICIFKQVKHMTLSKDTDFHICIDGELIEAKRLEIDILPKALKFKGI